LQTQQLLPWLLFQHQLHHLALLVLFLLSQHRRLETIQ
jgi:hypothetical protein